MDFQFDKLLLAFILAYIYSREFLHQMKLMEFFMFNSLLLGSRSQEIFLFMVDSFSVKVFWIAVSIITHTPTSIFFFFFGYAILPQLKGGLASMVRLTTSVRSGTNSSHKNSLSRNKGRLGTFFSSQTQLQCAGNCVLAYQVAIFFSRCIQSLVFNTHATRQ